MTEDFEDRIGCMGRMPDEHSYDEPYLTFTQVEELREWFEYFLRFGNFRCPSSVFDMGAQRQAAEAFEQANNRRTS